MKYTPEVVLYNTAIILHGLDKRNQSNHRPFMVKKPPQTNLDLPEYLRETKKKKKLSVS